MKYITNVVLLIVLAIFGTYIRANGQASCNLNQVTAGSVNGVVNAMANCSVDAGTCINNAISTIQSTTGGKVWIPPGNYMATVPVVNTYRNVIIECSGPHTTMINWKGSGAFYTVNDTMFGLPGTAPEQGAGMVGCDVYGTGNTNQNSGAFESDDTIGLYIARNEFFNFTQPGDFGIKFKNVAAWNERHKVLYNEITNNTCGVWFQTTGGDTSFEHSEFINDFTINIGQWGVCVTGGGSVGRGRFVMNGNVQANPTAVAISSASESSQAITITSSAVHGLSVGDPVSIAGVTPAGYNGLFRVQSVADTTHFTYGDFTTGLGAGSGGTSSRNAALVWVDGASNWAGAGVGPEWFENYTECQAASGSCGTGAIDPPGGAINFYGAMWNYFGPTNWVGPIVSLGYDYTGGLHANTMVTTGGGTFLGGANFIANGGVIKEDNFTLAASATKIGGPALVGGGRLIITESIGGRTCSFNLRGGANLSEKVDDIANFCSGTLNNANTLNVYNSSANTYTVQNNLGASDTLNLYFLRQN